MDFRASRHFVFQAGAAILSPKQSMRPDRRTRCPAINCCALRNSPRFYCCALWASAAPIDARVETDNGIVRVKSAVPTAEAISRIKADIASKGIRFFMEIDQSKLAADAGIQLRPSTLLVFGNPPLGTQFITSNPNAGLDWPVRLLLTQDDNGDVWAVWTDFEWIARRHNIRDREAQFKMATKVVQSIISTITTR